MMSPSVTPEMVAAQIREKRGNLSAVADELGVSRQGLYKYIARYESLKKVVEEARERMKDMVESTLYSKALEGEGWAVCFFLKTQAKDRGYVERSEVTGAAGGAINYRDASKLSDDELAAIVAGRSPRAVAPEAGAAPAD